MTSEGSISLETEWVEALVHEARRDLVFLWHIEQGRFGGPSIATSEFGERLGRIVKALVQHGCIVGFGNPDSSEWQVPTALAVPPQDIPAAVVRAWSEAPDEYKFLVFALRS